MAASASDAHPYPIYNARYRVIFPLLDADGDLVTGATTPDSELSQDCGTFADATNEMTEIATSSGMYYLDLIATELDTKSTAIIAKSATAGMKTTPLVLYPVRLPVIRTGTAQAGAASTITLDSSASAITDYYEGCFVNITNNSPANALGQARRITAYNGSTKVATVEGTYGTNPSNASTFEVLATPEWSYRLADLGAILGTVVSTPATAGILDVNTKNINNVAAATPGASGGVLISGSNSGTTTLGALTITGTTTYTGTTVHTGNVSYADGITVSSPSTTNRAGLSVAGNGTGAGLLATGGATGIGLSAVGGATSGDAIKATTTSGHGLNLAPVGTSMYGLFATGGNGGTSDGIKAVAGTGGVPIRGDITGNLTGTVATLTTYTGNTPQTGDAYARLGAPAGASVSADVAAVKTDTAAVKTKTDFLPSATAGAAGGIFIAGTNAATTVTTALTTTFTGNLTGSVGSVTGAVGSVTGAVGSVTAAVAITSNIKKNQALAKFQFLMTDSTGHAPATGKTVTCTRSIDGGAYGTGTLANIAEVANGTYTVDFGAGDLNGNVIILRATATACDDTFERIVTQP
jgi:hypothetical protein